MKRFFGALLLVGICLTLSAQLIPTRRRLFASSGSGGGNTNQLSGGCGTGTPNLYWTGTNFVTSGSTIVITNVQIPSGQCSAVFAFFSHYNSGALRTVISVALQSQNSTFLTNTIYFDNAGKSELYGFMNPTSGTNNMTITLSGSITEGGAIVTVVTNSTTANALFQASSGTNPSGNGYTNVVNTAVNAYIEHALLFGDTPNNSITTVSPETSILGPQGIGASGKHTLWAAYQIAGATTATNKVDLASATTVGNHIIWEVR